MTARKADTASAAAAFDAIVAKRPLRPPPLPEHNDTRTAGALVLAKEIRAGIYTPPSGAWIHTPERRL